MNSFHKKVYSRTQLHLSGKSLSIICSALKWLKDQQEHQARKLEEEMQRNKDEDEPDWVNEQYQQQKVP